MKILIIDTGSEALDFAIRCIEYGHDVVWFTSKREDRTKETVGEGIVPRIHDLDLVRKKYLGWADLIFLTDNTKYLDMLEPFRELGYPIFGPSPEAADLELNRALGQEAMKAAGLKTLESRAFHDYKVAARFVEKNQTYLVSKPSGEADKALSYVADDAPSLIYMLERWDKDEKYRHDAHKHGFILQEKIEGVEMAVGGWFGPGGWSKFWYENFEEKKLMNGGLGPNTGEMGCYDEATEVLTKNGWKAWADVLRSDHLATLKNGRLEYELPSALVSYDVDTKMIGWKNQTLDVLVTPNHNMYIASQWSARRDKAAYRFVRAENCTQSQYTVPRTAVWSGNDLRTHIVPGYTFRKGFGFSTKNDIPIDAEAFARFVGLYVAEGSSSNSSVHIAQSHKAKADRAEKIVAATGFPYRREKNAILIFRAQLARYLKPLGRAWEKRVPEWIKDSSPRIIKAFLEGYALGDGHLARSGARIFYTCSSQLADDVQELLLKIGRLGTVRVRSPRTSPCYIDGRKISSSRPQYEIHERTCQFDGWLDKRDKYEIPYRGRVYCATVSSHLLFVRRNGKPMWCGNTTSMYVRRSKLADVGLKPLTKQLKKLEYVGFIDINGMIDTRGDYWPFELTCRPGWPTHYNQAATHRGDPAQWMVDLIVGRDTLDVAEGTVCVSVVVATPDFPYSKITKKQLTGIPVYNANDREHVHLCEVMMGQDVPVQVGESIARMPHYVTCGDYVAVVTGCGDTITGARRSAYAAVKKLRIPNSPFYRTDIGLRLKETLPKIQRFGFAKEFSI